MQHGTADQVALSSAAQAILRLLIASYFIAVALQLIPGTNLGILFSSVLPAPYDAATSAGIVFILAFMVMAGMATRAAALIIALMTFYASYLTMISLGIEDQLGSFWRDLALIAALLLTYSEPQAGSRPRRRLFHRHVAPRRVAALVRDALTPRPMRPAPAVNFAALRATATPVRPNTEEATRAFFRNRPTPANLGRGLAHHGHDTIDNIFADDPSWTT